MTNPNLSTGSNTDLHQAFFTRHVILNKEQKICGYQLQYPKSTSAEKTELSFNHQSIDSIHHNLISQQYPIHIAISSSQLTSSNLLTLPTKHIVLDITDDKPLTAKESSALANYLKHQFKLSITLNQTNLSTHPLLNHAHYIQLDIEELGLAPFAQYLRKLRFQFKQNKQQKEFIAVNVNNHKQLKQCLAVGADYIQGYFFTQPSNKIGQTLSPNQAVGLQLISELQSSEITPTRVAELISQTPQWSYRLLRLINSVAFEMHRKIESLEEAVIYLGLNTVCNWVSLMILTESTDKPQALVQASLIRARMCETITKTIDAQISSKAFLVGLFSTLDAMLDIPMNQVLSKLPLADDINIALNDHQGQLGQLCSGVIAYERGYFQQAKQTLDLPNYQIFLAYGESVIWAKAVCQQLELLN